MFRRAISRPARIVARTVQIFRLYFVASRYWDIRRCFGDCVRDIVRALLVKFQEYKVDSSNPKGDSRWKYTGSGTVSPKMPLTGDVRRIAV